MDQKTFLSVIKKPSRLAEIDFNALQQLIQLYPYSSVLHIMAAKKAQTDLRDEDDTYLAKAAIYALDRQKLFFLIHEGATTQKIKKPLITKENVASPAINSISSQHPETSEITAAQQDHTQNADNPEINKSNEFAETQNNRREPAQQATLTSTPRLSATEKYHETKKNKEKKKHKKKYHAEPFQPGLQHTFYEWLKIVSKHKAPLNTELQENYTTASYEAGLMQEIIPETPDEKLTQATDTEKKKTGNEPTEIYISELAEKSIRKNENNLTETYAKILELQKKYHQAIEAYEKLSLKYPEKSSYFASRIADLKSKI
jgi:hypothetical protein